MNKYIGLIKTGYLQIITYRFDVFWNAVLTFVRVLLAHIMWSTLFKGKTIISGFTYEMMITYYILISFLVRLEKSEDVSNQLSNEIRNGSFAQYLTKPINVMGYYISLVFSKMTYTLWITILVSTVWALVFRNSFQLPSSGMHLMMALSITILGFVFLAMFNFTLVMLSFKFINISSFFLMKSNLVEFFQVLCCHLACCLL